jgi:hypothetical protein
MVRYILNWIAVSIHLSPYRKSLLLEFSLLNHQVQHVVLCMSYCNKTASYRNTKCVLCAGSRLQSNAGRYLQPVRATYLLYPSLRLPFLFQPACHTSALWWITLGHQLRLNSNNTYLRGGAVSRSLTNPSQPHSEYGEKDEWRRRAKQTAMEVVEWQSAWVPVMTQIRGRKSIRNQDCVTHKLYYKSQHFTRNQVTVVFN